MWKKEEFYGIVAQAQDMVLGFREGYGKLEQQVVLRGLTHFAALTPYLFVFQLGRFPEVQF